MAVGEQQVTGGAAAGNVVRLARIRSLFPFSAVIVPWFLSRVISITVLLVAVRDPARGSRFSQVSQLWDGTYYLDIGRHGYGDVAPLVGFPKWPFFPGLPALIRVLGELGSDEALVFVVNQLMFLVALAGLYRLARRHAGDRGAALTVWALAFFPASFVFSMTYPSALFLAASVWAFTFVEDRVDLGAGVLAAGAAIVRPNGIVVAIALVCAVRSWRRALIVAGPAVAVIAVWCWYCYDRTGDAFVFLTTKARWEEISAAGLFQGDAKLSVLPHGLLAIAAIAVVVLQRRRLPGAWIVLTALSLLPSLITGMVGLARYSNECFPPFVAAGQVLERWSTRAQWAALALSTFGMVVFAFIVGRYSLVP
ncbi:MAG: glycosyltransferase family 39 protein [Acidimicrobiia bacterium]